MKFNDFKNALCLPVIFMLFITSPSTFANDEEKDEEKIVTPETSERLSISFVEPDKYTDIRPSNQLRSRFTQQVLDEFSEYFDELAQKLPAGQVLDVKMMDIDLAGDTRSARFQFSAVHDDIRVIEDIFFPRLDFEYELKDKEGVVLQSQAVSIKDMNFMHRVGRFHSRDRFSYEKQLLDDWYKDTFVQNAENRP